MNKKKIGLLDIDSKIPNLALMKLSAWHKTQNDEVKWWNAFEQFDKVYVSKIFPKSKFPYKIRNCEKGGSGFSLTKKLLEEIEHIYPDYSLYNIDYAMGYISRGCINKCPFCIVWRKEGNLQYNFRHPLPQPQTAPLCLLCILEQVVSADLPLNGIPQQIWDH